MTLEKILEKEKKYRCDKGIFGVNACKESILREMEYSAQYGQNKTLYTLLSDYVNRANTDVFFNKTMVLACWELINEGE